jgi:hypothetical protein
MPLAAERQVVSSAGPWWEEYQPLPVSGVPEVCPGTGHSRGGPLLLCSCLSDNGPCR